MCIWEKLSGCLRRDHLPLNSRRHEPGMAPPEGVPSDLYLETVTGDCVPTGLTMELQKR